MRFINFCSKFFVNCKKLYFDLIIKIERNRRTGRTHWNEVDHKRKNNNNNYKDRQKNYWDLEKQIADDYKYWPVMGWPGKKSNINF
jgi:hypothetical protein